MVESGKAVTEKVEAGSSTGCRECARKGREDSLDRSM